MYATHLAPVSNQVDLMACQPGPYSPGHLALSYAQFAALNELHRTLRGGADILEGGLECPENKCVEFAKAVGGRVEEMVFLYTRREDRGQRGSGPFFFVVPGLVGSGATVLAKVLEGDQDALWGSVRVKHAAEIEQWLLGATKFFAESRGIFKV